MGFKDWADSLRLTKPQIDINPRIDDEKKWREWGNSVIQSNICQTYNVPRTDGFSNWREWAIAMIRAFGTAA
jgi:hypothetical protein